MGTPQRAIGEPVEASGFFVLRTPLLPFDEVAAWSRGVRAPGALSDPEQLEAALTVDRGLLTERLLAIWRRPEVREAIFLASPELNAGLERYATAPRPEANRALRSLATYFARMTARSTPFGLFAGCSVGILGDHTRLDLSAGSNYTRHTRLDMDYLSALTTALEADASVRSTLCYRPNSSLYRAGGRLHYAESRLDTSGRSYHLVAVDATPELTRTLERASGGAALAELAAGLADDTVSHTEAREFVEELVDSQVLVADLGPNVTGQEAIHALIGGLARHAQTQTVAARLEQTRDELAHLDRNGVGAGAPARYLELQASLQSLPATPEIERLFQVDMVKPVTWLSLGAAVQAELLRGLGILHGLAEPAERNTALNAFQERFIARYEAAEVPLLEALDEEVGIGFAAATDPGGEPLLQGLDAPPPPPEPRAWRRRDDILLRLLLDATGLGELEIQLGSDDLAALASVERAPPLPDALDVIARLAAPSAAAVDRGDFQLWLQGASGPSGARLLGRFCHADPALHGRVEAHLHAEEACRPGTVFAEIVHLPEGRLGNILSRPLLRGYEIPFLGQSAAASDRQIAAADLWVSVRDRRVVLRSARLNREVLPRLTTAHNFTFRSLGVYRFLCALQHQGITSSLGWSWGPLEHSPFLPRVVSGRLVLARATWNMVGSELEPLLRSAAGAAQFAAVQRWRAAHGLPRYVALADGDNELLVDLDNVLSVEALLHLVKGRPAARLVELFPAPDKLCVTGPEGRFVHELIVPFVTTRAPVAGVAQVTASRATLVRRFSPGSEWLYAKLYCGLALADRLLVEHIRPVLETAVGSGAVDRWFFIRYTDPDFHLRLRLHGDPRRLTTEIIPLLESTFAPLVHDSQLARWQLDTYVREVERYGGNAGILLAESLFGLDSDCALAILESVRGDAGLTWRWKLAVCGVDLLLDALGMRFEQKCEWARERRDAFAAEFRVDSHLRQQLGDKWRAENRALQNLLRLARAQEAAQYPALRALRHRSEGIAAVAEQLWTLDRRGQLGQSVPDLAASYAHMHVNRLLRSAHRFQELAIYDLLDRAYRGQLAASRT